MSEAHLLLGGGGFVGRHVALLLARQGHEVIIASRTQRTDYFPEDLLGHIRWVPFSLCDANWDRLLDGVDVVHHYAWSGIPATANDDPAADLTSNVRSTLSLLEALRKLGTERSPRLLFTSSGGTVYGRLGRIPVDEAHPLRPMSIYGASKAAAELYVTTYRNQFGVDGRIARLSNPFGAGQDVGRGQGAVTIFMTRALRHEPIVIWGDGEVVRDYIHVMDAAEGLITLARAEKVGAQHVFNVGSGHGVSLNAIVEHLEAVLGRRLDVHREVARPYDVPISILDISSMHDLLGWKPQLSFAEGLRRTLVDLEQSRPIFSFCAR